MKVKKLNVKRIQELLRLILETVFQIRFCIYIDFWLQKVNIQVAAKYLFQDTFNFVDIQVEQMRSKSERVFPQQFIKAALRI